jgi:predicted enzyme related to lactoylglutathione lyase
MAFLHRPARRFAAKMHVNEKRGNGPVMTYQVPHEYVHDVVIQYHTKYYSSHHYSTQKVIAVGLRENLNSLRMIKGIKFVSIPVSDQERALAFYTGKLGFRILTDQQFDEKQRWIELSIPGAETGVVLFTPPGHESRIGTLTGISFHTADVQSTYDELLKRGVEFTSPPAKQPWGTYTMFKDPDGNQFVMSSK